jgi:hypothetical protein
MVDATDRPLGFVARFSEARTRLGARFAFGAGESGAHGDLLTLTIVKDGQSSARQLPATSQTIGYGPEVDILVQGLPLGPLFTIDASWTLFRPVISITSHVSDLRVDRTLVGQGKTHRSNGTVKVVFEGVDFTVAPEVRSRDGVLGGNPRSASLLLLGFAALLAFSALVTAVRPSGDQKSPMHDDKALLKQGHNVLDSIASQLTALNLAGAIDVSKKGDKILLTGTLPREDKEHLVELLNYLNNTQKLSVEAHVGFEPPRALPIAFVAVEPNRYVVLQNGIRYAIGDTLPTGERVTTIAETELVVRDGELYEIVKIGR